MTIFYSGGCHTQMSVSEGVMRMTCMLMMMATCASTNSNQVQTNMKLFTLRTLSSSPVKPHMLKTSSGVPQKLPPPLMEDMSEYVRHRPTKRNLRPGKLLNKMGDDFKPNWMSVERPYDNPQDAIVTIKRQVDTELLPHLSQLNFTYIDEQSETVPMKDHVQKAFEKWLLQKASCPVQFVWEDIGSLFWPRYIKQGICIDETPSCSWPPGMHCVPAESHAVRVLRWHCRRRQHSNKKHTPDAGSSAGAASRKSRPSKKRRHRDSSKKKSRDGRRGLQADSSVTGDPVIEVDRARRSAPGWSERVGWSHDGLTTSGSGERRLRQRDVPQADQDDVITDRKPRSRSNKDRSRNMKDRSSDRGSPSLRCKWIKVNYPVTAECFCSC